MFKFENFNTTSASFQHFKKIYFDDIELSLFKCKTFNLGKEKKAEEILSDKDS